ncbi:MAG: hypothetical protein U9R49_11265 [Bacteroidota bacterium]|nr:hypothetical protein [Bacteroidota bacterium]
MKTKRYTTATLIALVFATASIQAQSARRLVTQEKKERARTTTTYKRESTSQKAKSTQPARKVQTQQVRKEQTKYKKPAPNNNGRQYVRNQNANNNRGSQVRNPNGNKNHGQQVYKPVSMTTNKNPRSTYRKPNKVTTGPRYTAPVKTKKYKNRNFYGGNHYHYAYPTRKVKFHYHHNTYVNHYNVLYYPSYGNIYWTRNMYRDYRRWYPEFHWRYNYGYRIQTISVFDAKYNLGEVAMVYGRVYASWYNDETDDYLLFFGGDFPYQQFTVVVPGHVARRFSWRPERYFLGEHITVTGLITTFDGSPEIIVKNKRQLGLY